PLFFCRPVAHRDLPSFPTRRSSDLLLISWAASFGLLAAITGLYNISTGVMVVMLVLLGGLLLGRTGTFIGAALAAVLALIGFAIDRKSTRLNSSHVKISYAVFCLKK